jgi:alpha-N-arabinofuranosidase
MKRGGGSAFIARRQQHHDFDVMTKMIFNPNSEHEVAGLMAGLKANHSIHIEVSKSGNETIASVYYVKNKVGETVIKNANDVLYVKLEARGWDFQFYVGNDTDNYQNVGGIQDARIMSLQRGGGFTGSYVGMYASSNGEKSDGYVAYEWFEYSPVDIK